MTNEEAIEILDRYAHHSPSEVIKYPRKVAIEAFEMAIAALKAEPCEMRDATEQERKSIDDYVKSMSRPTGFNVFNEQCDDTISRKHLLSEIDELMQSPWFNRWKDDGGALHFGYTERKEAVEIVRDLCVKAEPPVTPKQKVGKWVFLHDTFSEWDGVTWYFKCSECGRRVTLGTFKMMARPTDDEDWKRLLETYPYCHCGAKMEGVSE